MQIGNPPIRVQSAQLIIGSDECGYGSWAGPLLVVAVCVPLDWEPPPGLTDSKKLTEGRREALMKLLQADPRVRYTDAWTTPEVIDKLGVYQANIAAHKHVHGKFPEPDCLHVADGNLDLGPDIVSTPKADMLIPACSAASVIAKVLRDKLMTKLDETYPGYGFKKSKGYGVPAHMAALKELGPCKAHRMSYEPVARAAKPKTLVDIFGAMDELTQE